MDKKMMWAYLIHLGMNMWDDPYASREGEIPFIGDGVEYSEKLLCDRETWREVVDFLPSQGINTLLIDIGEAVRYRSHPELAIEGSWTRDELKAELERIRSIGLEPLPKLNFSACHDAWLKEYSHMLSTRVYYDVCRELIDEVCELFGSPRLFHLGMDEETYAYQKHLGMAIVRGEKLWWKDLYYLCGCCERNGARAWIWSDYYWSYPELFKARMPKSVLQSNWHYSRIQKKDPVSGKYPQVGYQTYVDLDALGYDQVPTSSTWDTAGNSDQTVNLTVLEGFDRERLLGFMTAPWQSTVRSNRLRLMEDAQRLGDARRKYFPD